MLKFHGRPLNADESWPLSMYVHADKLTIKKLNTCKGDQQPSESSKVRVSRVLSITFLVERIIARRDSNIVSNLYHFHVPFNMPLPNNAVLGLVTRKPVCGVSDQVGHKQARGF